MDVLSYITIFLNLVLLIINIRKHGIPLLYQNDMDEIAQNQEVDCRITENHHLLIQARNLSDKLDKLKFEMERFAIKLKEEEKALKQEIGVLTYENELLQNRNSALKNRVGACVKTIDEALEIGKILADRQKSYREHLTSLKKASPTQDENQKSDRGLKSRKSRLS